MKKHFILTLASLTFALIACNKEDDINQKCEDLPQGPDIGYSYESKLPSSKAPCFNPNNSRELCFVKGISVLPNNNNPEHGLVLSELWKVNLETGKQEKLAGESWSQPDWGRNGWILYEQPGNQILKIKSNGDSLTQLTFQDTNFNPKWNNKDNTFIHNVSSPNHRSNLAKRNTNGKFLEYVKIMGDSAGVGKFSLSPNGNMMVAGLSTGRNLSGFYIFNLPNLKPDLLFSINLSQNVDEIVTSVSWHPDNRHIFWTNSIGLYKTDVVSKQTWQLKSSCESRTYVWPTVSPDGQTIAVSVTKSQIIDGRICLSENEIWLMDDNGHNERKLEL